MTLYRFSYNKIIAKRPVIDGCQGALNTIWGSLTTILDKNIFYLGGSSIYSGFQTILKEFWNIFSSYSN